MAIRVGYFEDQKPEHYIEGPFVMVYAHGWRVECRGPGRCSVLPLNTAYESFVRKIAPECLSVGLLFLTNTSDTETRIEQTVDRLNKAYMLENGVSTCSSVG